MCMLAAGCAAKRYGVKQCTHPHIVQFSQVCGVSERASQNGRATQTTRAASLPCNAYNDGSNTSTHTPIMHSSANPPRRLNTSRSASCRPRGRQRERARDAPRRQRPQRPLPLPLRWPQWPCGPAARPCESRGPPLAQGRAEGPRRGPGQGARPRVLVQSCLAQVDSLTLLVHGVWRSVVHGLLGAARRHDMRGNDAAMAVTSTFSQASSP